MHIPIVHYNVENVNFESNGCGAVGGALPDCTLHLPEGECVYPPQRHNHYLVKIQHFQHYNEHYTVKKVGYKMVFPVAY